MIDKFNTYLWKTSKILPLGKDEKQCLIKTQEKIRKQKSLSLQQRPRSLSTQGQKLIRAARLGDLNTVADLLASNVHVDTKDNITGLTPLIAAAMYGHPDVVQHLLAFEPDVDIKDKTGKTALDYSKQYNYKQIQQALQRHKRQRQQHGV